MHIINNQLEEIKQITNLEYLYFDEDGKFIGGTTEPAENISEAAASFADSVAESQEALGFHFIKIRAARSGGILLVSSNGESSRTMGLLAAREIKGLLEKKDEGGRGGFFRQLLLGNLLPLDIYQQAKALGVNLCDRIVYVIHTENKSKEMEETLRNFFEKTDDIVELDDENYVLVREATNQNDEDFAETARAIVDVMMTEAASAVMVSYGNPVSLIEKIPVSYQEACLAMEVGKIFYEKENIFPYTRLGIGRLIYQLPKSLCEMFIREVFGDKIPDVVYDEETMETIDRFMENNLNISETARQLYVHRNTLVYRLEKLQETLGLDIRKFEDAMTFRIAYMVLLHLKDVE